jgi:hypothetical protein
VLVALDSVSAVLAEVLACEGGEVVANFPEDSLVFGGEVFEAVVDADAGWFGDDEGWGDGAEWLLFHVSPLVVDSNVRLPAPCPNVGVVPKVTGVCKRLLCVVRRLDGLTARVSALLQSGAPLRVAVP